MSNAKHTGAKPSPRPSSAVAELAKRVGWTTAEVADAIDETIKRNGPSERFRALMSAACPSVSASPSPLMRRSLEAHRLEILRETGAASVSIVVTY